MGSFYQTCGVSNLPILDGDLVACLILKEKPGSAGSASEKMNLSPDAHWDVIGPPIFGIYNSYGVIDNIESSDACRYLHSYFQLPPEENLTSLLESMFHNEPIMINNIKNTYAFTLIHLNLYYQCIEEGNTYDEWQSRPTYFGDKNPEGRTPSAFFELKFLLETCLINSKNSKNNKARLKFKETTRFYGLALEESLWNWLEEKQDSEDFKNDVIRTILFLRTLCMMRRYIQPQTLGISIQTVDRDLYRRVKQAELSQLAFSVYDAEDLVPLSNTQKNEYLCLVLAARQVLDTLKIKDVTIPFEYLKPVYESSLPISQAANRLALLARAAQKNLLHREGTAITIRKTTYTVTELSNLPPTDIVIQALEALCALE